MLVNRKCLYLVSSNKQIVFNNNFKDMEMDIATQNTMVFTQRYDVKRTHKIAERTED